MHPHVGVKQNTSTWWRKDPKIMLIKIKNKKTLADFHWLQKFAINFNWKQTKFLCENCKRRKRFSILTTLSNGCEPNTLKVELDWLLGRPGVQHNTTACCPTRVVYSSIVLFNFLKHTPKACTPGSCPLHLQVQVLKNYKLKSVFAKTPTVLALPLNRLGK